MIPLRDNNPTKSIPIVTYLLIAANFLVFVYSLFLSEYELQRFIMTFALIPAEVLSGNNLGTLITSLFLHASVGHLLSNMLFLGIFGDNVEDALGKIKFLGFYFLCGLVGSLLQIVVLGATTVPNLGASGAVAGLMGAYLKLYPHAEVEVLVPSIFLFYRATVPAFFMLFYWIFAQFLFGVGSVGSMQTGGVAYFAHIGGFLTGYAVASYFVSRKELEEGEIIWPGHKF